MDMKNMIKETDKKNPITIEPDKGVMRLFGMPFDMESLKTVMGGAYMMLKTEHKSEVERGVDVDANASYGFRLFFRYNAAEDKIYVSTFNRTEHNGSRVSILNGFSRDDDGRIYGEDIDDADNDEELNHGSMGSMGLSAGFGDGSSEIDLNDDVTDGVELQPYPVNLSGEVTPSVVSSVVSTVSTDARPHSILSQDEIDALLLGISERMPEIRPADDGL